MKVVNLQNRKSTNITQTKKKHFISDSKGRRRYKKLFNVLVKTTKSFEQNQKIQFKT